MCSHGILLISHIDHDTNEGGLLNYQINHRLGSIGHQECILPLESLITDREVLWHLLMIAGPEFRHVPNVIQRLHDSHPVCLVSKAKHACQLAVMFVHRCNHVSVYTSEAISRESRRRLYSLL